MRRSFPLLPGHEFAECVTELRMIAAVRELDTIDPGQLEAARASSRRRRRPARAGAGRRFRRER